MKRMRAVSDSDSDLWHSGFPFSVLQKLYTRVFLSLTMYTTRSISISDGRLSTRPPFTCIFVYAAIASVVCDKFIKLRSR